MGYSFDDHKISDIMQKLGVSGSGLKVQLWKILVPVAILWLPLAAFTLFDGTFWTGDRSTSFITNFDSQARLLVSLPIFIMVERLMTVRIGLILEQFVYSGFIIKKDEATFQNIVEKNTKFLKSIWSDIIVLLICYIQVILIAFFESEYTNMLTWQADLINGEPELNLAGYWSILVSRPLVLFLFYRWLLRIVIWGIVLRKISNLNLNLFPSHPDLMGGLGFLGYGIRYFAPVAFAISATVAGNAADYVINEGIPISELRLPVLGYLIFMTIIFALPLLSFMSNLVQARERTVFDNYAFANGMYRELRKKFYKGYAKVDEEDLDSPSYSSVADLNAVVENSLRMKFLPFTIKDLLPLWAGCALPFLGVVLLEIPISEILERMFTLLI